MKRNDKMTFDQFVAAVDLKLRPFGVVRMVEQDRDGWAGWKTEHMHAQLHHHPEDFHFPVRLGFSNVGVEGIAITASVSLQQLPLKLNDYGARTATLEILKEFRIDFDPEDVT